MKSKQTPTINLRSESAVVIRGAQTLKKLMSQAHQTFADWEEIAAGLEDGRRECLAKTGANSVNSNAYKKLMEQWVPANGYQSTNRHLRSWLHSVYYGEHCVAIKDWYSALKPEEQLKTNYPQTVLSKFKASQLGGGAPGDRKRPSLQDANVKLQEELDTAKASIVRLEREDRGPLVTRTATVEEMARVINEWLPANKRGPVAALLMQMQKSTEQPPAAPAKRARRSKPKTEPAPEPAPSEPTPEPLVIEPKDIEADCAAYITMMREMQQRWNGPSWRGQHGVSDAVVEALLERGVIVRHPVQPDTVGLSEEDNGENPN